MIAKPLKKSKEQLTDVPFNPDVLNLIAPTRLSFDDPEVIGINGKCRRIAYVKQFEEELDPGWASCLVNSKGNPVTTFVCTPSNIQKMKKGINNSDSFQNLVLSYGGSATQEEDALHRKTHGRAKLRLVGQSGEAFFDTAIYHQITAKNQAELAKIEDGVSATAIGNGLVLGSPSPLEESAFKSASPFLTQDKRLAKMTEYPGIMSSTIAAAELFSDTSLDDGHGYMPGVSTSGNVCRIAINETSENRSNCNIALLGSSGMGKTMIAKSIGDWTTAMGGRFFYFDAELDGVRMTERLGGVRIDVGGGMHLDQNTGKLTGSCISPFEPRLGNYDSQAIWSEQENEENVDARIDVLRATLTFLHGWTSAMWGTPQNVIPALDRALIHAYKCYGIEMDTSASDLKPNWYPVMQDIQDTLLEFEKLENEGHGNPDRARIYRMLADYAEQGTERGAYGNLTAYRSNVQIGDAPWVTMDVHSLVDMEPNVVAAQMYSVLSWAWSQACVSHATGQFVRMFIDELYLFFGGGFQSAVAMIAGYINMIQKRIRKYNGSLMIATQQLSDVLDPSIRRYGEAILTSSTYKAFFGTTGTDLALLQDTFRLSSAISDKIASFGRGRCIWRAGTSQIELDVALDPWQLALYNKDLNRGERR